MRKETKQERYDRTHTEQYIRSRNAWLIATACIVVFLAGIICMALLVNGNFKTQDKQLTTIIEMSLADLSLESTGNESLKLVRQDIDNTEYTYRQYLLFYNGTQRVFVVDVRFDKADNISFVDVISEI